MFSKSMSVPFRTQKPLYKKWLLCFCTIWSLVYEMVIVRNGLYMKWLPIDRHYCLLGVFFFLFSQKIYKLIIKVNIYGINKQFPDFLRVIERYIIEGRMKLKGGNEWNLYRWISSDFKDLINCILKNLNFSKLITFNFIICRVRRQYRCTYNWIHWKYFTLTLCDICKGRAKSWKEPDEIFDNVTSQLIRRKAEQFVLIWTS